MLIYGLVNSAVLALMALGFNLTFGISGVANFTYGAIYVVAGFLTWSLINKLHLPYAGVGGARHSYHRLCRGVPLPPHLKEDKRARDIGGHSDLRYRPDPPGGLLRSAGFIGFNYSLPVFVDGSVEILGTYVDIQRLLVILLGIACISMLYLFTHHTKIGLAFRGIAQEEHTSLSLGINPDRIAALSMGFGSALGAFAAIVILPLGTITVDGGYDVLINALSVCIVGGLGSTFGVIIAAFIIGYAQTLTSMYISEHWVMIVSLLAILIILAVRPSGLLGHQKELEERV